LATGLTVGSSQISASLGAITGQSTLTVSPATLMSIAVTPAGLSMAKGTKQLFVATGTYTDGSNQDVTQTVTWASSVMTLATISNAAGTKGLVSAVAMGATEVSATSGTVVGKTALTVTAATLVSIAVTPGTSSIAKGNTQQFVAEGTYSDDSKQDLSATTTWASSVMAVAGISNAAGSRGLATSATVGTTEISANSGGIIGKVTLTVTAATLVSIAVTPAAPSIVKNATQQFTATGKYTDASTQDLTTMATWASATEANATVSTADGTRGLAKGVAVGTSVISAVRTGITGSVTLTVTAAP